MLQKGDKGCWDGHTHIGGYKAYTTLPLKWLILNVQENHVTDGLTGANTIWEPTSYCLMMILMLNVNG